MTNDKTPDFNTVIVIATNGFVWVAQCAYQEGTTWLHLNNARIIRVWGTDQGLAQLTNGPRKETVLDDMAGVVSLNWAAVIAVIPSNDANWSKHLGG